MKKVQIDSEGKLITLDGKALIIDDPTPTGTINIGENGTYDVASYATAEVSVSGGGSSSYTGFLVQVIDYDGTILKSERLDEGDTFTLPEAPTHSGLTFKSWSSPVTITNNTVTVGKSDINIGAVYDTESGLSEFDVMVADSSYVGGLSLEVTLDMDGTKDWGDGTSDTSTTHTYSSNGDYTITCTGTVMNSSHEGLFGSTNVCIKDVRLMNVTSIPSGTFSGCSTLKSITIPDTVVSIGSSAFEECYSLKSITIPDGVTTLDSRSFYSCKSLDSLIIPSSVTTIGSTTACYCGALSSITIPEGVVSIDEYAFSDCYSLTSVTIPSSVETFGSGQAFGTCYALKRVVILCPSISGNQFYECALINEIILGDEVEEIGESVFDTHYGVTSLVAPSTLMTIGSYAFSSCPSLTEIDFSNHTAIPTVGSSVFGMLNPQCIIYVPMNLYNDWVDLWGDYPEFIQYRE